MRIRDRIVRRTAALASIAAACFSDAPPIDGGSTGTDPSSTTSPTTSATTTTTTTTASESADTAEDTSDATTASTTSADDDSTGSESSTTGASVACECPGAPVLCEGFENGLALWPDHAGEMPVVVNAPVQCGEAALAGTMPMGGSRSVLTTSLAPGTLVALPSSMGGWLHVGAGCLAGADVRLVRLQFDEDGAPPEYAFDVVVNDVLTALVVLDAGGSAHPGSAGPIATDVWLSWQLDFHLVANAATLTIDGVGSILVEDLPVEPNIVEPTVYVSLGPDLVLGGMAAAPCTVTYDQIWLGPTP